MASDDILFLSMVHPASPPFSVAIKIDRLYSVEHVEVLGEGLPSVKTLSSVDVVVYDEKGTKMILRLNTQEIMDRFVWLLYPGFTFELIRPRVGYGGLGIVNDYHLEAVKDTHLKDCLGVFPPVPFDIWTPAQLTSTQVPRDSLFDVVGFLQYVSPIGKVKNSGFWDKEIRILLSCRRNKAGGSGQIVMCVLRGPWLDVLEKVVKDANLSDVAPFIHIRYVVYSGILESGIPLVESFYDASFLDVDPPSSRIQQLKIRMLSV